MMTTTMTMMTSETFMHVKVTKKTVANLQNKRAFCSPVGRSVRTADSAAQSLLRPTIEGSCADPAHTTIRHVKIGTLTSLKSAHVTNLQQKKSAFVNPLDFRGSYSATSNNIKLVHCRSWMGCYIWYSEEGTGRGRSLSRPLLAVPNLTSHLSTASLPITV